MWRRILAAALAWLARLIKKKEQSVAASLVFKGKVISVADIETVATAIATTAKGIAGGKTAAEITKEVAPSLLGVAEDVASMFFPGAGVAIEIVAFMLAHARPMTQEETNVFMDRFGAGSQS